MRLLTHNLLKNNSAAAKGNGYPLRIVSVESIRVDDPAASNDAPQSVEWVQSLLPTLHWSGLVQAAHAVGIHTLPNQLTEEMAQDTAFLRALHHILMHVHVVNGTMECPVTQRQFPIRDEIPDMMLADEECERVR